MLWFFYRDADPWQNAPPWAVELRKILEQIHRTERYNMAQQEDIKDALAVIRKDVADQTTVIAGMSVYVDAMAANLTGVTPAQAGTKEPVPAPVDPAPAEPNPFTPEPPPAA